MKKIIVILLLSLYGTGTILFPGGDLTCLPDMYKQCQTEDPDMNAADFVFEHLLNIPDLLEHFGHEDEDKNEKPHQPFHSLTNASQTIVTISKPVKFECSQVVLFETHGQVYPLFRCTELPVGFLSETFHPPAV